MICEKLSVKDFPSELLREALQFYTEGAENGKKPQSPDFQKHFHCSRLRAEMLTNAASWAYKVQQKEKAQMEAKRKRAC